MALPDGFYNIRFVDEPRVQDKQHVKAEGVGKPLILGAPGAWPQLWDVRRQPDGEYTLRLLPVGSDGLGVPGFSWAGDVAEVGAPVIFDQPKQFLLDPTGSGPEGPDGGHYMYAYAYSNPLPFQDGILPVVKCVGISPKLLPNPELQIQEYMNDQKLPVWEFSRAPPNEVMIQRISNSIL
ncbi:hypothetical protein BD779DRAFT_1605123 [Infundibulicybe gibba]|nr:hypothetical protein BD779DRAFT_1605123 [Infundibulicybe gibba]